MSGFPTLLLGQPGFPACPDRFTAAGTLECGSARRLRAQISVQAVWVQFGVGIGGPQWGPEQMLLPTTATLVETFDAVRVRNFTAGVAAQVVLTAFA